MNLEQYEKYLEATQADRDMMNEWINEGSPWGLVNHLRLYREAAENIYLRSLH